MGNRERVLEYMARYRSGGLVEACCERLDAMHGSFVLVRRLDAHAPSGSQCSCSWVPDVFDHHRAGMRVDEGLRLVGLDPSRPGENL